MVDAGDESSSPESYDAIAAAATGKGAMDHPAWLARGNLGQTLVDRLMSTKASIRARLAQIGLAPRGLSREEAAAYINVSARLFDRMVEDGRMPRPKRIDGRRVWDRIAVDKAFTALPDDAADIWDRVAV